MNVLHVCMVLSILRHALPAILCVAAGLLADESCGDTHGYEFRPGPRVPATFKPGPGVDASHLDLRGSVFIGMDLSNANFQGADLRRATFIQVSFLKGGASFRNAGLRDAAFDESPHGPWKDGFRACDFTDALINGLTFRAQQDHLSLDQVRSTGSHKSKDLSHCQIVAGESEDQSYDYFHLRVRPVQMDLAGFDLRGAVFAAGDFRHSDFRGAVLTGTTFFRCVLNASQIAATARYDRVPSGDKIPGTSYAIQDQRRVVPRLGTDFSDIGFADMNLSGWDFAGADLRRCRFWRLDLKGVDFTNADVRGAHFYQSINKQQLCATKSYRDGDLAGGGFSFVDLSALDFSGCNLTGVQFVQCDFSGALLADTVITRADFSACIDNPPTLDQIESTWNYKHGRMAGIVLPKEIAEALKSK